MNNSRSYPNEDLAPTRFQEAQARRNVEFVQSVREIRDDSMQV